MWRLCCLPERQVAIAAPRGHAKSTAITHSFVLAAALWRLKKHILIVSDTESQAVEFLGDIKTELLENELLIETFKVQKLIKDSATEVIVGMEDGWKFRLLAKGAEQKVRGRKWRGTRPDLAVVDDLENEELTESQDRREKLKKWFYGALLPAMSDDGWIRVVGTVMHFDSALENLMPTSESGVIESSDELSIVGRTGSWVSAKFRAHNGDFSQILWPDKFSAERLKAIRTDYATQGIPEVYGMEYLNDPIDHTTAYFKREDFLRGKVPERGRYYAAIDFAISQKERADYTVIAVACVDEHEKLYVVDIRRGRWDAIEILEQMFSVQKRYSPDLFVAEAGAIEKALGPFLRAEMLRRNEFINLRPETPTKDKQSRARSLQARMRAGGVTFCEGDWYDDLFNEMTRFPKGPNDDQVDALAWIGLISDQLIEAPTAKETEDEEYELEFGSYQTGRSAVTGY